MGHASRTDRGWWHRTAELLASGNVVSEAPPCRAAARPVNRRCQGPGLVEDVARSGIADGERRADHRGRPQHTRHRHRGGSGGGRRCPPSAARVPATCPRSGRASPRSRRGAPPFLDIDPEGGTLSTGPAGRHWPRRSSKTVSRDPATGHRQTARQSLASRAAGAIGGLQRWPRRTLYARRTRAPRRAATRVRPSCRQRRGARRRPPPVPVPAGRRPRLGAESVTTTGGKTLAARRDLLLQAYEPRLRSALRHRASARGRVRSAVPIATRERT